ncbi:MAG: NADH-quinone oxidoreductase subunit C [Bacteriovoracaceae bacterium]|nr:NADH-quinone oxidoreductase subunit C [Bacteriovoracaceae bacterium]
MLKDIASFLNSQVSGSKAEAYEAEVGDGHVSVAGEHLFACAKALKESSEFDMNVLQVVSGVDYADRIEVNYMLASFTKNTEFILKVKLPKKSSDDIPEVDSVCSLWKAANFLERETYDMVGVKFNNHPDHRRILCPEDWEGFPLRRDYVVQKEWDGIEVNPAHKVNSADHNFFKDVIEKMGGDQKKVTYSWKSDAES